MGDEEELRRGNRKGGGVEGVCVADIDNESLSIDLKPIGYSRRDG